MSLLNPASIAVIGASAQEGKVGHDILRNLLTQGFRGEVYPINPKGEEILGKRAFASVRDAPGEIDLAVIVTPAATVEGVLRKCAEKKIPSVIVISAGFGEAGTQEGKDREAVIRGIAREHGMQVVGPNCLGVLRPPISMNASFALDLPPAGGIALLSQSGAFAVPLIDAAAEWHLGFSWIVSMGNKTVMDECDFLELCVKDSDTRVIGLYLESIRDGQRFRSLAERIAREKPIVLIKSGVTERGKVAVSSHTGALAGSDAAIDAVCAQTGIHRARATEEFLDLLRVLSSQPPLLSPRIAIVTNAGGPGILATDAAEREHLSLPGFAEATLARLREALPATASTRNPVDVVGDAGADRYGEAVEAAADDPSIDGLVCLLTPQVMTPCEEIARHILDTHARHPLIPVTAGFMGGKSIARAEALLEDSGIPNFATPERAVSAIAALQPPTRISSIPPGKQGIRNQKRETSAQSLLTSASGLLSDALTQELFTLYALPLPKAEVATTPEHAAAIAERIGFPVIAKVSSRTILHKTDIGGVRANLQTIEEVRRAFGDIKSNVRRHHPQDAIQGILIQKFLPAGSEFIVGALKDPSFGHLVMAGLGGIYAELFRDTAFRIAPLAEADAYAMLQELGSWKLLLGMRGKPQADIAALVGIILSIADLVAECPQISAIDCNPVLVEGTMVTIADAKVII